MISLHTFASVATCVVAALLAGCEKRESAEVTREVAQRDRLARELLFDAGAGRAWAMSSRSDVLFEDGFSGLLFAPPHNYLNHAFRWMSATNHVRLKSHGARPMRLFMHGWADPYALKTRPEIAVYIDGRLIASMRVPEDGLWGIETIVPPELLREKWVDMKVTLSAVAFHWADAPYLQVAMMNGLEWTEVPTP
jgi:hypothetical protein